MSEKNVPVDVDSTHGTASKHFERTVVKRGEVCRHYKIGGQVMRFRFAGSRLADLLTPAINHLAYHAKGERPNLRIDVWESPTSPVELTDEQWMQSVLPLEALGPHDFVYCQPDIGMLVLFRGNHALLCYRDISALPPWELAIPFRVIFNSWFQRTQGQVIHGAAIANDEHAVILAGVGGAGKSSTALSCLNHPSLKYMADDLCLLRREPNPMVYGLYNTIKIRKEGLHRFGDMRLPHLDHLPLDHGKPTFFLQPHFQYKLAVRRPVRAILLPKITHTERTSLVPAKSSDAWQALVPSTFAVILGDRAVTAQNINSSIKGVPVYWLELGTDRNQIADVIGMFLNNVARKAG